MGTDAHLPMESMYWRRIVSTMICHSWIASLESVVSALPDKLNTTRLLPDLGHLVGPRLCCLPAYLLVHPSIDLSIRDPLTPCDGTCSSLQFLPSVLTHQKNQGSSCASSRREAWEAGASPANLHIPGLSPAVRSSGAVGPA
ncbi:hypothetical protein RRG08_037646 [Elysia crispata]|uniref:Uncharacterized protein n=1 Tax=Elysia crispata TaxID=231223 RepID=A0AAE0YGM3_9GAST|nr:hypothetical protein RRG08_037646 [Elysia crispata]